MLGICLFFVLVSYICFDGTIRSIQMWHREAMYRNDRPTVHLSCRVAHPSAENDGRVLLLGEEEEEANQSLAIR